MIFGFFIFGFQIAKTKSEGNSLELDQFQAVLPMSSSDLAYAILKTGGLNVLYSGFALLLSVALTFLCLVLLGNNSVISKIGRAFFQMDIFGIRIQGYRFLLCLLSASALISWICMGLGATLALTGERRVVTIGFCLFTILFVFSIPFLIMGNSYFPEMVMMEIFSSLLGSGSFLVTVFVFYCAMKRRHLKKKDLFVNFIVWLALFIFYGSIFYKTNVRMYDYLFLVAGITALAFLPLAAAPLALEWNRHR